ncbi:hypothetical protein HCB69_15945 [Listeria booriae]|uniref:Replicative helicase inhibitor G39P N-terminal domain-containing protein n=1 Tax=Listeria booriae TaxID=1552123 RepID=A0A842FX14_9LIST|nr:replicative helicase loader/inhibitor [Listeria booriae]MBC2285868.1 hypothetical protein [Listeria booriae]
MTPDEIQDVIKSVAVAYRNFDTNETHLKLWADMLRNGDYEKTRITLEKHIASNRFPPSVAEILVKPNDSFLQTEKILQERKKKIESNNNCLDIDDFSIPEVIKRAILERNNKKPYKCPTSEEEYARRALIASQKETMTRERMNYDKS